MVRMDEKERQTEPGVDGQCECGAGINDGQLMDKRLES